MTEESGEEDPTTKAATTTDDHWPDRRRLLWHAAHHLRKLWCRKDRVDSEQYQLKVEKQPGSHARYDADDRTNVGHTRSKNNHATLMNPELQRIVDASRVKH